MYTFVCRPSIIPFSAFLFLRKNCLHPVARSFVLFFLCFFKFLYFLFDSPHSHFAVEVGDLSDFTALQVKNAIRINSKQLEIAGPNFFLLLLNGIEVV